MSVPEAQTPTRRPRRTLAAMAITAVVLTIAWLVGHGRHEERTADARRPAAASTAAPQGGLPTTTRSSPSIAAQPARNRAQGAPQPGPLPPAGTPLAQTYGELKARADAGDAAAAARLYDDVHRCLLSRMQLRVLRMQASVADNAAPNLRTEQLEAHEQWLAEIKQQLHRAEEDAAQCSGMSDEQLRVAPVALTAALLGDKAASDCYVSGVVLLSGGLLDHPEWLQQYKDNAVTIADNALAAGDWDMVDELQHAYEPVGFHFGPLADLIAPDAAMSYRLLRLQRLGASGGSEAAFLDKHLATAAQDLSADAISAGDAWAQDTFIRYFSGGPPRQAKHRDSCD